MLSTRVKEAYDRIFEEEKDYSDDIPKWMKPIQQENWKVVIDEFTDLHSMVQKQIGNQDSVRVIDIGCGDGLFVKRLPEKWISQNKTRWVFADNSLMALRKCENAATSILGRGKKDNLWTTELLDVNVSHSWENMYSKHSQKTGRPFDIAVCHGVTVHVDILSHFFIQLFRMTRYAIVEFADQTSRLSRLMAEDDYIKHGFVYNMWNEYMINHCCSSDTHNIIFWNKTQASHIIVLGEFDGKESPS